MSAHPYPKLFQPFVAGRLDLPNRLVVLPHGTSMVRDGNITADDIAYYEARARSRPGLIVAGAIVVDKTSSLKSHALVEAYEPRVLEMLQRRSDAIHAHGVKLVGQIIHLGREMIGGESEFAPSAPSPIRSPRDPFPPHELSPGEISRLVQAFGATALNLKRSGHDGVEIHGAHGYLVAQFLSPATNRRNDAYGGTPEKRMRFLLEVIESIRTRCGEDFLLGLRLSGDEEIADGLGIQDNARIAAALAPGGAVDYLSITLGTRGSYVKDVTAPEAPAARAAQIIREACGLPIIVGQRINTPETAERLLAEGAADLIGMARAFITDPDWAAKAARGEADRIRPCIGLNQDCRSFSPHLHCAVNPTAGRERLPAFGASQPTRSPRRIAVVGGGPGGLEFARVAALRGHRVTLFESTQSLGGQFLYASALPHRLGLRRFIDHQQGELRHLRVNVELGARIDDPGELRNQFELAVLATGAVANPLPEELAHRSSGLAHRSAGLAHGSAGLGGARVKTWFDILNTGAPAPGDNQRALMVDDGSAFWWTYGVAEVLAQAGWQVTLVTPSTTVAAAIPHESVGPLLARLGRTGTRYRVLATLYEVTSEGAHLVDVTSGEEEIVDCGLVVVQTGRSPVTALTEKLRQTDMEYHTIGDCVTPRRMSHAVFEAHRLAGSL